MTCSAWPRAGRSSSAVTRAVKARQSAREKITRECISRYFARMRIGFRQCFRDDLMTPRNSARPSIVLRGRFADSMAAIHPSRLRFPAARRLKSNREFERVRRDGRDFRGALMILGVLESDAKSAFR